MENTNHLSQYGRDAILLERGEVACGASGHAPFSSSLNVSGGTLDLRADKLLLHNPEKL